jgi:lipopolysaccharide/colanic/teichoic acid biosynthesis glycosyltransferase
MDQGVQDGQREETVPAVARGTDPGGTAGRIGVGIPIGSAPAQGPIRRWYPPVKLAGEWFVALLLAVVAMPFVMVLAALVRVTSSGPAFFWQRRLGLNGRPYYIVKLRTMRHNCEARTGPVWAMKNDSRITPIGSFLRETHLDELPQLWNILCGHMSLIGPRPERPELVPMIEREVPNYGARLRVRPGVTGLAQMRLPADQDVSGVHRKLAHDLYYIQHLSPLLDVRIALSTGLYCLETIAHACCNALVGSYGRAAERHLGSQDLANDRGDFRVGAAG